MKNIKSNPNALHNKIELKGVIDSWSRIFVVKLQDELKKKKIVDTGALLRSIKKQLLQSSDGIHGVIVRFHMYGRFVDMGVGNGLKAYERKFNKPNMDSVKRYGSNLDYVSRKPRRWFNKRKMAEIYRLREILNSELSDAVVENFKSEFGDFTEYSVGL